MKWVSTTYQFFLLVNLYCLVFAVFCSDEKDSAEFSLHAMNNQINLSGSLLVHDLPSFANRILIFL
jgi:hypothetical protein